MKYATLTLMLWGCLFGSVSANSSTTNLWEEISNNHSLTGYEKDNGLFWHIKWFKENPDYLTRVTKRAQPYLKIVLDEVKKRNLPYELALLPIVESAYYPFSYSHGTASGLWQFIGSTGKLYGLRQDFWVDERRDIVKSTRAALQYLQNLYTLFGDWQLAIASYNSGPGRVQRAIAKNKRLGRKTDFWHIKLPDETRGYLPRLLAVATLIKHPEKYGQVITPVYDEEVLTSVFLKGQLDISLISEFTGLTPDEIYELNPALNRFATPENYNLLLPVEVISQFRTALGAYPTSKRIDWIRHKVRSGDSLSKLASEYRVSTSAIKVINELASNTIVIGDYILIPTAQKATSFYTKSLDYQEDIRLSEHSEKVVHTIKKGESLWDISMKYGVSVKNIVKWNKLPSSTIVQIGDKLAIYKTKPTKMSTLVKTTKLRPNITRTLTYTVKSGDSFWSIAKKFKLTSREIASSNNLDINKALQPGQKLTLEVNIVND